MSNDLLKINPCPFCGSDDVRAMHGKQADMAWCYCLTCLASGPTVSTQTESDWAWGEDNNQHPAIPAAILAWNNRHQVSTDCQHNYAAFGERMIRRCIKCDQLEPEQ